VLGLRHLRAGAELVGGGEIAVTAVCQLVGEAVGVAEIAFQHLLHERLGIGHVFQAIGAHRIGIEAMVFQEFIDGADLADIGLVIFAIALHHGVVGRARHACLHVAHDEIVAQIGRNHRTTPGSHSCRRVRALGCAKLTSGCFTVNLSSSVQGFPVAAGGKRRDAALFPEEEILGPAADRAKEAPWPMIFRRGARFDRIPNCLALRDHHPL